MNLVMTNGIVFTLILLIGFSISLAWADEKIIFSSERDDNIDIFVINPDGTWEIQLTHNSSSNRYPAWSPDGEKIAFMSTRDGDKEIYIMNSDGTEQKRLTNNQGVNFEPTWAPYGTDIAFTSNPNNNCCRIFIINLTATAERTLTEYLEFSEHPTWSPDGTKIAFTGRLEPNEAEYVNGIFVINSDGTGKPRLLSSHSEGYYSEPDWSPDGTKIVFTGKLQGESYDIYVMNDDGTNVKKLTDNPKVDRSPSWSPDGTQIVFNSQRDSKEQLYIMNADGTDQRELKHSDFYSEFADWHFTKTNYFSDISSPLDGDSLVSLHFCKNDLLPIIRSSNGVVNCVTPSSFPKLVDSGWGQPNVRKVPPFCPERPLTKNDLNKFEPFITDIQKSIDEGETRLYSIIIIPWDADNNKKRVTQLLKSCHGAENVHAGTILSFVTAKIPITEIPKIAQYGIISMIGDGEKQITLENESIRE